MLAIVKGSKTIKQGAIHAWLDVMRDLQGPALRHLTGTRFVWGCKVSTPLLASNTPDALKGIIQLFPATTGRNYR